MKYYAAAAALVALVFVGTPSKAQILQKLEQGLLGGQGQQQGMIPGTIPGTNAFIGNVNLPPGQYMMTNVQTGQAFYVMVQNGQMALMQQPSGQGMMPGQGFMPGQGMVPGQGFVPGMGQTQQPSGVGGMIENGLGNFLRNKLTPQQQQQQQTDAVPMQ